MPFEKRDAYYQKELDAYYGEDISEFDIESGMYMGHDGSDFLYDRYRTWLMKVLIATNCDTIEKAIAKYPFIAEDTKREDYGDSDLDDESGSEQEKETPAKVVVLDASDNGSKKAKKRTFATLGRRKQRKKSVMR